MNAASFSASSKNENATVQQHPQPALQDFQTQLAILQHQNRRRILLAQQEQESTASASLQNPNQEYEMQLKLLEQENKRRLLLARQEQDRLVRPERPRDRTVQGDGWLFEDGQDLDEGHDVVEQLLARWTVDAVA
jgi:hypothetical protein